MFRNASSACGSPEVTLLADTVKMRGVVAIAWPGDTSSRLDFRMGENNSREKQITRHNSARPIRFGGW